MKEVFDDQVLEEWGAKDWREVFRSTGDDAEFMQVGGGRDPIPIALIKEILKYAPQGAKFIQKGWQKAVQAYKGELVKGLKIDQNTLNKIPKELGDAKIAQNGSGLRWFDSKGKKSVRVMKGDPSSKYPHEQVNYVQLRSGGQVVLKDGTKIDKPITGQELRKLKDAHIPYEEWIQWRSWDKP